MKTPWPRQISILVPYVAVLLGLYILKNAWIAIGVYHSGVAAFLIASNWKNLLRKVYAGWNSLMTVAGVVMAAMIVPILFFLWEHIR